MNDFLIYILKSTISISLLYLGFRILMRKETFFKLNRALLLSVVVCSAVIPLLYLPQFIQPTIQNGWMPRLQNQEIMLAPQSPLEESTQTVTVPTEQTKTVIREEFPWIKLLQTIYLAGILITLLILIHGIISILMLFRKAKFIQMDGFRLLIIEHEISPFSFGRIVVISQSDYDTHQQAILAHEEAHIRLNHFFDLALLETIKILHWFNPVIYWLIRDMKEIHEFQADQYTLNKGIDATQYQILIIQKSVGPQRFALANSFNHCQIKKRIIMMNKQKTSKARRWKVATFLPLLALLLMAFSKTGGNVLPNSEVSPNASTAAQEPEKQWTEADFGKPIYDVKNQTRTTLGIPIRIDSESKIFLRDEPSSFENITTIAKQNFDYNLADEKLKKEFEKISINGQQGMAQRFNIPYVFKNPAASPEVVQKVLNSIGKAAMETRQKYASEIYKTDYQKLTATQKSDINKLVPAVVVVQVFPFVQTTSATNTSSFSIEIRAEGIIIPPSEKAISLAEMKKQVEIYATGKTNSVVSVKTANGLNSDLLNKVKDALKSVKNISSNYTVFDPVYVMVDEMPEFPGGIIAFREWVSKNTKYPEKANKIEGKVYVSFFINSKGKAESAKIEKGLSPELDAEALKIVSQMPVWKPGKQNGIPVNVKYTTPIKFSASQK
jgi:TonB family protein